MAVMRFDQVQRFISAKKIFWVRGTLTTRLKSLMPRLYGEKLSRVEGSPAYPSYPGRANFSYISLQNLANRLHEKQKLARLEGLPA